MEPTKQKMFKDDMTGRLLQGRYRIVRRLATGGMAVVYLARSEGAEGFVKPVVVKIIHPGMSHNEEYMGLFIREARIMASLKHPGIVSVIEFLKEQNYYIMVLEYVHGFQLAEWRRFLKHTGKKIPIDMAIHIMVKILEALHYAQTLLASDGTPMKIVHRDISPSNIMLDTDGSVKLVDFGIARITGADESLGYLTKGSSTFRGKLPYSAPELLNSDQPSAKSDIYSCGITLHELLVGRNEFASPDPRVTIQRVVNYMPGPLKNTRGDAPEGIDEVLQKALAKDPKNRYETAAEFAEALLELQPNEEKEVTAALAATLVEDFGDPMADFLKVESLDSRDKAWRMPSDQPEDPISGSYAFQDQPEEYLVTTKVEKLEPIGTAPPGQTQLTESGGGSVISKYKYYLLALVLLILIGGIGLYFAFRPEEASEKRYLLVQSPSGIPKNTAVSEPQPNGDDISSKEKTSPVADAPSATVVEKKSVPTPKTRPGPAKRKPRAKNQLISDLSAAFKKRQGKIRACFDRHVEDLAGQPKIAITFTVGTTGEVKNAGLSPSNIASTAFGKCLLNIAQTTRFPPHKEQISFRIPISAWYKQ